MESLIQLVKDGKTVNVKPMKINPIKMEKYNQGEPPKGDYFPMMGVNNILKQINPDLILTARRLYYE